MSSPKNLIIELKGKNEMKPSFTTLGSPGWSLDEICQKGAAAGFEGVDFRGLQDNIDITTIPEFTTQLGETKRKLGIKRP